LLRVVEEQAQAMLSQQTALVALVLAVTEQRVDLQSLKERHTQLQLEQVALLQHMEKAQKAVTQYFLQLLLLVAVTLAVAEQQVTLAVQVVDQVVPLLLLLVTKAAIHLPKVTMVA
jgi:hypothetical protein